VRDAATALTQRGVYPSASHIADILNDRNVMRSRITSSRLSAPNSMNGFVEGECLGSRGT
jgi:hypothetical protein